MTDIEESESEFDLEHHGILGMKWGRRKSRASSGTGASRKAKRAQKAAAHAAKVQARKTERARRRSERDARRAIRHKMKLEKADRKLELVKSRQDHQERMMRMKIEEEMQKRGTDQKINPALQNQVQQKLKSLDSTSPKSYEATMPVSDHQRYLELSRKKVSQMSTNELNEWVNRTNAIQNYQRLTAEQAERNASAGKKIMNFVFDAGKEAAKEFAKQQIKSMVTKGLGNALSNAKSGNSAASNKAFQEVMKRARHARR